MPCRKLRSNSFRVWSSDKMAKKNKKKSTPPKLTSEGKISSGLEDPPAEDDIDLILEQGRSEGDPFHAVALFKKVLQAKPEDTAIMGEAAELLLQVGETAAAKEILFRSISLAPEEEPDKYLNMAQLHEGRQALDFYEKGLEVMHKQLSSGNHMTKGSNASLKQRMCMAYCSVGELYLTDLCFEEDAEKRCQDALDESMKYDYGGPEPPHTMANLRLSQHKFEEAVQSAEESFRRLGLCEPPPEHEFRVSLAKILLECSTTNVACSEKAIEVLGRLMQEDDENVEVWYLMGVAFNSLQPPDLDSARAHLERAGDMLSKIKTAQEEMGENFAYEDQVQLVQDQLEQMGKNREKSSKAMHEMPIVTQTSEDMDCA